MDKVGAFCYLAPLAPEALFRTNPFCFSTATPLRPAAGRRDNNVDQALKALKKKMQREGSFREMKRHVHYEKPSEKRARQKAEAVRRARKLARKRAQREGLIAAPKKPVGPGAPGANRG
jgi:small subunit ribosomal protein S21